MDFIKILSEITRKAYVELEETPSYGTYRKEEWMIPMRDGVKLRTRVYKPSTSSMTPMSKEWPVILERTCYPEQSVIADIHGENLARRGYIFISQLCRGVGGSQGEWVPNINERNDGSDFVSWLNEQPWVSAIGYWGNSYLALTGWAIADIVPDKVKGMCLTHYGTDRFKSAYEKGMFRQDVLTSWSMNNAGYPVEADRMDSYRYMPQIQVDEALWGKAIPWYREWITNTHSTDEYWQKGWWKTLHEIPKNVHVPLYIRSGWYDHHHGSAMNTWAALSQETKKKSWLDIGGWNHGFRSCIEGEPIENPGKNEVQAIIEWFDLILKRKETPTKRIATYVIRGDRWEHHECWPEQDVEVKKLFFNCHQESVVGKVSFMPVHEEKSASYQYDPNNPVPSVGAESLLAHIKNNGSLLQQSPGTRMDVLSFVSDELTSDIHLVGAIRVRLFVSTDCEDTAFTAKIMEIQPDGKSYSIRSSIASISHSIEGTYEPGSVISLDIECWDVDYLVKQGSKLRVDISSSDFPQYHIHSNQSGEWVKQTEVKIANQTVYCGGNKASYIELPVR